MKLILLILLLIPASLSAEKEWVQKHYAIYEVIPTLQCTDSTNCYAFADSVGFTIIYRSTDQGNSWHPHYRNDHLAQKDSVYEVFQCYALDSMNLYMTYLRRAILEKSTDGGKTFKRILFGDSILNKAGNIFFDIKMYDKNIGAGIAMYKLVLTDDNWETFKIIDIDKPKLAGGPLFFIDSNNIAVLKWYRNDHEFLKYNIENDEWSLYNTGEKPPEGESLKEINDVFFVNDTLGYACGSQDTGQGDFAKDIIWKTYDRGQHWEVILDQEHEPVFGLSDISFRNEKHGMAVGSWGKIVETTDGGVTWNYHEVPDEVYNTIRMLVAWAGEYPIIASNKGGIHRLEETTGIDEYILKSIDINIRQTSDKLLISIEDKNFRKYKLQIVDLHGNIIQEEELSSGIGTLFKPVNLNVLYRLSGNETNTAFENV